MYRLITLLTIVLFSFFPFKAYASASYWVTFENNSNHTLWVKQTTSTCFAHFTPNDWVKITPGAKLPTLGPGFYQQDKNSSPCVNVQKTLNFGVSKNANTIDYSTYMVHTMSNNTHFTTDKTNDGTHISNITCNGNNCLGSDYDVHIENEDIYIVITISDGNDPNGVK